MGPGPRLCLDGSTVVVTGASAGIGREFAVQLAPRAGTVVLVARRAARLEQLRAELIAKNPRLRVVIVAADLADPNDVERALVEIDHEAGRRRHPGQQRRAGRPGPVRLGPSGAAPARCWRPRLWPWPA